MQPGVCPGPTTLQCEFIKTATKRSLRDPFMPPITPHAPPQELFIRDAIICTSEKTRGDWLIVQNEGCLLSSGDTLQQQ